MFGGGGKSRLFSRMSPDTFERHIMYLGLLRESYIWSVIETLKDVSSLTLQCLTLQIRSSVSPADIYILATWNKH